ncbi:MAG TPA: L-threonylcarbamoyladenylate synthase [Candidatus Magasanikbacteria bacterium]|nr:L-threonylcarbamoyladenylate synthase [Candidatus Magasanikbacteria bacterium]
MKIVAAKNFEEIKNELRNSDSVFIYPTETCYGIGADATDAEVVRRIYEIKKRPNDKSAIILVSDMQMAEKYAEFGDKARELANKFWPGALTLVLPARAGSDLAPELISDSGEVAMRISGYILAKKIVEFVGRPIVSTSANISGGKNIYKSSEINAVFSSANPAPDFFIDDGDLVENSPTTLLRVRGGEVEVLRQGGVVI